MYVTSLAGNESDVWVGTLNRGVLHWHAGQTESFDEQQGMPDPQVQSIAVAGDKTYVGTVLGRGSVRARTFLAHPGAWGSGHRLASGRKPTSGRLRRSRSNCHPARITSSRPRLRPAPVELSSELGEIHQLFDMGESHYALTRSGLYRISAPCLWLATGLAARCSDTKRSAISPLWQRTTRAVSGSDISTAASTGWNPIMARLRILKTNTCSV